MLLSLDNFCVLSLNFGGNWLPVFPAFWRYGIIPLAWSRRPLIFNSGNSYQNWNPNVSMFQTLFCLVMANFGIHLGLNFDEDDRRTYDIEIDGVWLRGLGGDLALVDSRISLLQFRLVTSFFGTPLIFKSFFLSGSRDWDFLLFNLLNPFFFSSIITYHHFCHLHPCPSPTKNVLKYIYIHIHIQTYIHVQMNIYTWWISLDAVFRCMIIWIPINSVLNFGQRVCSCNTWIYFITSTHSSSELCFAENLKISRIEIFTQNEISWIGLLHKMYRSSLVKCFQSWIVNCSIRIFGVALRVDDFGDIFGFPFYNFQEVSYSLDFVFLFLLWQTFIRFYLLVFI